MSDLSEIKTGDYVALYNNRGDCIKKVQVERVTNAQIVINGEKYSKEDGHKIEGSKDRWFGSPWIRPLSKEVEDQIEALQLKEKRSCLINKIRNYNMKDVSLETLEKIIELLDYNQNKKQ